MSRGMTLADFVQQVFYAVYKVRLDVTADPAVPQSFHSTTDKFKEIVMEANFVLQELQKEQDWNWLRSRWVIGESMVLPDGRVMEFELPAAAYKICTGFNDAVRLHHPSNFNHIIEIPFTSPRSGNTQRTAMFNGAGQLNPADTRLLAFVVGDHLTFSRPFGSGEAGWTIETDVIDYIEPLHICDSTCASPCQQAYEDLMFTQIPDPYYMVIRTAAKRAEGDPSASDRVLSLQDECMKVLSSMRSKDSAKTEPDTYTSIELGFTGVF